VYLPSSERIFIDANIFIYHFTGVSPQCSQLLERCEQQDLLGVTSVNILLEVLHRLMMIEAVVKELITPGNAIRKLKERPQLVKPLRSYQEQTEAVLEMGIKILAVGTESVKASGHYRQAYGLMVNDSVTASLAVAEGIKALASADRDLERVKELTVYSPTDIANLA
jgi:predicted nucleic acid-binding protein